VIISRSIASLIVIVSAVACGRSAQQADIAGTSDIIPSTLPLKYQARPTTNAITAGDLMSRLYIFADDSMQGRDTGTPGHVRSTAWIERELRALGLEPAGENGSYFQDVPMIARRLDASKPFGVEGRSFTAFTDYVSALARGTPRSIAGIRAVYAGIGGDSVNTIPAERLTGKVAVFRAPAGTSPSGFGWANAANAAALVIVTDALPSPVIQQARNPAVTMPASAAGPSAQPVRATIYMTPSAADALFDRPLSALTPGAEGKAFANDIPFGEMRVPARNVIAIIRGSDPALRNSYVALGAHNDHVGIRAVGPLDHDSLKMVNAYRNRLMIALPETPTAEQVRQVQSAIAAYRPNLDSVRAIRPPRRDSIFNGADDDGSGSVGLLEIAEAVATSPNKPKRSLLFVWHAGEEKGLLGARWLSEHMTVPRDSIIAQVNIDMIGRGGPDDIRGGGPNYLQIIGARRLSTQLGDLVEAVNRTQASPFTFDFSWDATGHPQNIYCRSDHYHYARWGIPVAFIWTGLHGDYHQLTDEPQYIDYPHMTRVTRFVHDVAVALANRDQRPVVDKPKLDPNGACRQ
jgi:hypothetical protein